MDRLTLLEAEIKREAVHRASRPMGEVVMRNEVPLLTEDVPPAVDVPENSRSGTPTGEKWWTKPGQLDVTINDNDESMI